MWCREGNVLGQVLVLLSFIIAVVVLLFNLEKFQLEKSTTRI